MQKKIDMFLRVGVENGNNDNVGDYKLGISKLTAKDAHAFNSYIKAVACNNFLVFIQNYTELFADLFDGITIQKEGDGDTYLLSKFYTKLSIMDLKKIYEAVLNYRNIEFASWNFGSSKKYEELTDYEKAFYKILFLYGHKIGGYTAMATMTPSELVNILNYFGELEEEKIKQIENLKK